MLHDSKDKNLQLLFLSPMMTIALLANTSYLIYKTVLWDLTLLSIT